MNLSGVEVISFYQGIDGAYCSGYQVLIPLEGFQCRFLERLDRSVMGSGCVARRVDQLGLDAAAAQFDLGGQYKGFDVQIPDGGAFVALARQAFSEVASIQVDCTCVVAGGFTQGDACRR